MPTPLRLLSLEDSESDLQLILLELQEAGFEPQWERVQNERDFVERLDQNLDIILADYSLPQFDALKALRLRNERGLDVPFIIVSGSIGEDTAVAAMQEGAADYVLKDRLGRLGQAVKRALEQKGLKVAARRAERELREVSEFNRQIIACAQEGIIVLDRDLRYTVWNAYMEGISGLRADQVLGKQPWEVFSFVPEEVVRSSFESALLGEAVTLPDQYAPSAPQGRNAWVSRKISPMRDASNQIVGIVCSVHDITERKRAEQTHQESEARMRIVTDNARVGLVMVNQERRYIFANATYSEVLGLPASEILGRRVHDILPEMYEEQIRPRLDRAFAGERVAYELQQPAQGGDRYYAVTYEPRRAGESVSHVVVVIVDITERKQM